MVQRWHHHGDVVFQTGGLVYDKTTQLTNIECIIVVTDSIHIVKKYSTLSFICIRFRYYLSLRNLESSS